ncbi:MAG: enoyl-CoA hydratase/isomerase family protein [Propionibacteriaceae bacterium]|jgi:enoyl-CoA hydratase|nr:enoyl-CoA hydratase/isomerase family protein [Propionibacteriaceae bacterium]
MSEVNFHVRDGIGYIELNRPQAINALTSDMFQALEEQLTTWFAAGTVTALELSGAGDKGYCAGADVRQLRQLLLADPATAVAFLDDEYRLDQLMATAPVPLTAHFDGITMGGGVGLGGHRSHRIGSARTRWAMPEVGIGLWPDVGVCYELSRLPGQFGVHLGLTGATIDGASAFFVGLLDTAPDSDPAGSELAAKADWIATCYRGDDPAAIVARLEQADQAAARQAAATMRQKSPLSVAVTLAALRRAEQVPDLAAVFDQDRYLARHFLPQSDFVEGVRAQLVDRDRQPHWQHDRIEDVPPELVQSFFPG